MWIMVFAVFWTCCPAASHFTRDRRVWAVGFRRTCFISSACTSLVASKCIPFNSCWPSGGTRQFSCSSAINPRNPSLYQRISRRSRRKVRTRSNVVHRRWNLHSTMMCVVNFILLSHTNATLPSVLLYTSLQITVRDRRIVCIPSSDR